ncbi:MAG TPA: patatin [Lentisphaeria bacterium]|nr:MAG: hypothetical protein A2X47_01250 [Lentisphaerae bacterium GWF2_38_69]HBM17439.1 patatin [Lentisphaeria bacterium]
MDKFPDKSLHKTNKIGLVLSGGGAKGAYQIGVWKALRYLGIENKITAISGTSVGALNGAMFCQNDYELAEKLWLELRKLKVLTPDPSIILKHAGAALSSKGGIIGKVFSLSRSIYNHGLFSRKGIEKIIDEHLKPDIIRASKIPFYVCTLNISERKLNIVKLNRKSKNSIRAYLLASSAIPALFRTERIGNSYHLDGGLIPLMKNNTPFEALIEEEKCNIIINVYLKAKPDLTPQKKYSSVKFYNISPSSNINGIIPSLNFSKSATKALINQGFRDTLKALRSFTV